MSRFFALLPVDIRGPADRMAAIAAMSIVVSYGITHRFEQGHWWSTVLLVLAALALAALLAGRPAGRAALVVAVATGLAERVWRTPFRESDALPAVREALQTLLAGQNPYTHLTLATQPLPTFGFAYPPGALLFYLPAMPFTSDLRAVERIASLFVVLLLASLAWKAGASRAALATAAFGVFELAGFRALDGSNDTSLTALLLLTVTLLVYALERREGGHVVRSGPVFWASALPLALAVLFKQLAWPIALFLLLFVWRDVRGGRVYVAVVAALVIAASLPFVIWDPVAFIQGPFMEPFKHKDVWGANVWAILEDVRPGLVAAAGPVPSILAVVALAGTTIVLARRPQRDIVGALGAGLIALFVTLCFSRWTTSVYYIFGFALACAVIALAPLGRMAQGGTDPP